LLQERAASPWFGAIKTETVGTLVERLGDASYQSAD